MTKQKMLDQEECRHVSPLLQEIESETNKESDITRREEERKKTLTTIAAVAGNILEWYDFGLFGMFSDIIGDVFFAPQEGFAGIVESFTVFGAAFIFRPIGGMIIGYIGDKYGRKKALELSIFLMAVPTFSLGLLPSYAQVGWISTALLILVRCLQGVSFGGQLTSSLLFTVSAYPRSQWGFYGSLVFATGSIGAVIGTLVAFIMRENMSMESLRSWGWRLPFLSGIVVAFSAIYLKYYCEEDRTPVMRGTQQQQEKVKNPVKESFAPRNRRTLLSCVLVVSLCSAGGYVTSVWLPIYMDRMLDPPVPHAFGITCLANFLANVISPPIFGMLSDKYGTIRLMTIAACILAVVGPVMIRVIGLGSAPLAFAAQTTLGCLVSMWNAPMTAWLALSFPENIRLTAVSIGYNIALATVGGFSPAIATIMVDHLGKYSPGYIYTAVSVAGLIGLYLAPRLNYEVAENVEFDIIGNPATTVSVSSASEAESDNDIEGIMT